MPIESVEGRNGIYLHLCLSRGQYQLYTEHAIYSYGLHYANFYKIFKEINIREVCPEQVLILGLGLGSIPLMLEQSYGLDCQYTAVEYDEAVIELAAKYVLGALHSPISIVESDALVYLERTKGAYDLICIDIFEDDLIPVKFRSIAFLKYAQAQMRPGSVLLFNWLYRDRGSRQEAQRYFDTVFCSVFPEGEMIVVGLNAMLVARS